MPDAQGLINALLQVWPAPADAAELKLTLRPLDPGAPRAAPARPGGPPGAASAHPVSLNIAGEGLLRAVMDAVPPPHLMLEVPAFMAGDPANAPALKALREAGSVLLIKGRPLAPLSIGARSHAARVRDTMASNGRRRMDDPFP